MLILLSYIDNIWLLWQVAVCYSCSFLYNTNSKTCIALQFVSHWHKKTDCTSQMEQIFPSNSLPQKIKKKGRKEERENSWANTVIASRMLHLEREIQIKQYHTSSQPKRIILADQTWTHTRIFRYLTFKLDLYSYLSLHSTCS